MTHRHRDALALLVTVFSISLLLETRDVAAQPIIVPPPPRQVSSPDRDPPVLSDEELAEKSLPLRTALHHDPTLETPLTSLVKLYRDAHRAADLIGIYQRHLQSYPEDVSASIVLVRLMQAFGDPEADARIQEAAANHPDAPYLQFLLHGARRRAGRDDDLVPLERAIALEKLTSRKRAWLDLLIERAGAVDRRDMQQRALETLAAMLAGSDEGRLVAARRMHELEFHDAALAEVERVLAGEPAPEVGVDGTLLAAQIEVVLDRRDAATTRLDTLLGRVTADYWRRPEILRRRAALVESSEERDAMIARAETVVTARPRDEGAFLDLARLLSGFDRQRRALEVLIAGLREIPASNRIEEEILLRFERLGDDRGCALFLEERLRAFPQRRDLAERLARALFLVGRTDEAKPLLERALEELQPTERRARLLELGRELRGHGLLTEAADAFRRVVAEAPLRLGVRRELAECLGALGRRDEARAVMIEQVPEEAPPEAVLDLVQLMIGERFYVEAHRLLGERLERDPRHFEMQLRLIDVERRLSDLGSGARSVARVRELTDTAARYQRWLEVAFAFFDTFENAAMFSTAERERLWDEPTPWSAKHYERIGIFADVASQHDMGGVESLLEELLEREDLPRELEVELRRRLLRSMQRRLRGSPGVAEQLRVLMEDDPDRRAEYRAREALLHIADNRYDLAQPILLDLDVTAIGDADLLRSLMNSAFGRFGMSDRVFLCLERLTVLDATNRSTWTKWLAALASSGDESRLRGALRRVLRGEEGIEVTEETRAVIIAHLADSYWRSIGALLARRTTGAHEEALVLMDAVERLGRRGESASWVQWARAYALNELGRHDERDAAIVELERIAGDSEAGIVFPDGLAASMRATRAVLTTPSAAGESTVPPLSESRGPLPELDVAWAFEVPAAVIVSLVRTGERHVMIGDSLGRIHAVDGVTGKLLWEQDGMLPTGGVGAAPDFSGRGQPHSIRAPIATGAESFLTVHGGFITCTSNDGRHLWDFEVHPDGSFARGPQVLVAMAGALVIAHHPGAGAVAAVDRDSGKLRWFSPLPEDQERARLPVTELASGLSVTGDRVFVHGSRCAILDAADGATLWSFNPLAARSFPFSLDGTATPAVTTPPPRGMGFMFNPRPRSLSGRILIDAHRRSLRNWSIQNIQHQTSVVTPAARWASPSNIHESRLGLLFGRRLVLLSVSYASPTGEAQLFDIDLPLFGKTANVGGTFIGYHGKNLYFLGQQTLTRFDIESGEVRAVSFGETGELGRAEAAVDGARVYVASTSGVHCYNGNSLALVFSKPWPGEMAPEPEEDTAVRQKLHFLGGTADQPRGHQPTLVPNMAFIAGSHFVTRCGKNRVVALTGGADGR